ncbi:MAG: substrate-binding domain-containing protein [Planctomycetaceae bacterium]
MQFLQAFDSISIEERLFMDRRDALLTMLSTVVFTATGCSSGNNKKRIAVIPKGTTHDFWKSVHFGAMEAAKGSGFEIEWQGTTSEKDKDGQIKMVDNFIKNKYAGIVLAPIDRDAFVPLVKRAKDQGVPTVIFDSGLSDHSNVVSYVATNNRRGGEIAAEHMAKLLGGKGGVIMLRYQAGSESTEQREAGFKETLEKKYPGITFLSDDQRVDSNAETALKIAGPLLKTNRDKLSGVFTVCEPNNKGMLKALKENKLDGKVKFIAFDSDPSMIEGLREGSVHGVVLQNPVGMGRQAVEAMIKHLKGETVEKRIETGEVLATPENMTEEKVADLLSPKQYGE